MAGKDKNIELRSHEIQDILGKVPPWLIRSGMTGISLVVILLLVVAAWFRYPDRIESQIQLTTENPPVFLVARVTAKISEFLVEENQEVKEGDLLVVLESGADYYDVLSAKELVDTLQTRPSEPNLEGLKVIVDQYKLNLGNLQGYYAGLQKAVQELVDFLEFDKYQMRIDGLEKEARDYRIHYDRLYSQRLIKEEELKLAEKQFERMSGLFADGAISEVEYENAQQNHLDQKYQYQQARSGLSNASIEMGKLDQSISELKISQREEELNVFTRVQEEKDKFLAALSDWEQKYLLISPAGGLVSLSKYWSANQEVKQDTRVLAIVQETTGPILGKVLLPSIGAGKVKQGQNVIVRFDRYPYMEFGLVTGVVNSISLVPEESNYYVEVGFSNGLTTSYNRDLEFTQEMTGQAEIITETRSFLVRIITPLKSMLNRNALNGNGESHLSE